MPNRKVSRAIRAIALGVAAPILLLCGFIAYQVVRDRQQELELRFGTTTAALMVTVDAHLANQISALERLAESPQLATGNLEFFSREAWRKLEAHEMWLRLVVAEKEGTKLLLDPARDLSIGSAPPLPSSVWQKVAAQRGPVVGQLEEGCLGAGSRCFALSVPVPNGDAVTQVVSAAVAPSVIQALLAKGDLPPSLLITILDGTGRIVASSRDGAALVGTMAPSQILRQRGRADGHLFNYKSLEGEPYLGVLKSSPTTGWSVVVGDDKAVLVAAVAGSLGVIALAGVAALGASSFAAVVLGKRLGAMLSDVERSRLQELEAAHREAEEAKAIAERNALARSKFLATASHDLRQPVQSLSLLLEVVEINARGRPALANAIELMRQSLDALTLLLTRLLDVSRLDAGIVVPKLESVAVSGLLSRLGAEYRMRAEPQGLRLKVMPLRCTVRADAELLERLLRNLLENALRFTDNGGILLGGRRRGERVEIWVVDTGCGIPGDKLEAIFEEFYQVANPGRNQAHGLGLGLAIVQRIARLLDAQVTVRSVLGRGTSFRVNLPSADQTMLPAGSPAIGTARGASILVIEDDAILRASLQMSLTECGHRVQVAESGEDAADMIRRQEPPPDAVIADYRLGVGLNGIETLKTLEQMLGRSLPAIIVTGDTAPERIREVHASGYRMLHKPVRAEELKRSLAQVLGRAPEFEPDSSRLASGEGRWDNIGR